MPCPHRQSLARWPVALLAGLAALAPHWALGDEERGPFRGTRDSVELAGPHLDEISGICPSRVHPGDLWVQQDDAGPPMLMRFSGEGALRQMVAVAGVLAENVEDMALGPLPDGSPTGLFLADTGDNERRDPTFAIIILDERATELSSAIAPVQVLRAEYPDGPHNCEALFVMPGSGDIYIATKEDEDAIHLFRVPASVWHGAQGRVRAQEVGSFDLDGLVDDDDSNRLTGAAVSPAGNAVAVRTEDHVHVFDLDGEDLLGALRERPIATLSTENEPQGEAVMFDLEGRDLFTASEQSDRLRHHARRDN